MNLEDKVARVEELGSQLRKIKAELTSLLGAETRKGRPPKEPQPDKPAEATPNGIGPA